MTLVIRELQLQLPHVVWSCDCDIDLGTVNLDFQHDPSPLPIDNISIVLSLASSAALNPIICVNGLFVHHGGC